MSGAVAQRANGMSKALGGKVTFFYALTRVFLEWENTEVRVTSTAANGGGGCTTSSSRTASGTAAG